MDFPVDQIEELVRIFPGVSRYEEGKVVYFLISDLMLPKGCSPDKVDALFCPTTRDGYPSRLFFAEIVKTPTARKWISKDVRIIERNWNAFSWRVEANALRLAQMVSLHLGALR